MFNDIRSRIQDNIAGYESEVYKQEKETVRSAVLETITAHISTTVLVVGPQGVGKTKMVSSIVDEIKKDECIRGQYEIIKLDGYLQETDEVAVQHIVRVLNCDLAPEKELRGSAFDNLKFVIESLRQADSSKKSLIMIFDNFHIFCDGEKNLLYNLLDMVNRKSAAICVIGIATNTSCLDALHARTQSRLAITNVYLNHKTNREDRLILTRRLFTIAGPSKLKEKKKWNKSVEQMCIDSEFGELIENLSELDKSDGFFFQFLHHILLYIEDGQPLTVDTCKDAYEDYYCGSTNLNHTLKNLTILELGLVIAICHTSLNHDTYEFNFETVYECYNKVALMASGSLPKVDRVLAIKAFQNLKKRGYIKLKRDTESNSIPIEYNTYELLFQKNSIRDRIRTLPCISAELKQWMDNSLFAH